MSILCQDCKQAAATVHLTDIQPGGETVERHLCESCAGKEGITMKPHEPITTILDKFVKMGASVQQAAQRTCPQCGISFGEFRAQGLLGCPHDYEEFKDLLMPLIERAHGGATEHVGKSPQRDRKISAANLELHRIRRELEQAIAEERYEDAAKLRDDLKAFDPEGVDES